MFATAVFTAQTSQELVALPPSAIFRLHDKDWVFIPIENGNFKRIEIQMGGTNTDGSLQVFSGIKAGDTLISDALQLSAAAQLENPIALEDKDKGEPK
jgi:hypothetical protein